jgi:hypothetical protein
MTTKWIIDEIDGILILLGKQADKKVLDAFKKLEKKDLIEYRDSLVEEYHIIHPDKHLLVV